MDEQMYEWTNGNVSVCFSSSPRGRGSPLLWGRMDLKGQSLHGPPAEQIIHSSRIQSDLQIRVQRRGRNVEVNGHMCYLLLSSEYVLCNTSKQGKVKSTKYAITLSSARQDIIPFVLPGCCSAITFTL